MADFRLSQTNYLEIHPDQQVQITAYFSAQDDQERTIPLSAIKDISKYITLNLTDSNRCDLNTEGWSYKVTPIPPTHYSFSATISLSCATFYDDADKILQGMIATLTLPNKTQLTSQLNSQMVTAYTSAGLSYDHPKHRGPNVAQRYNDIFIDDAKNFYISLLHSSITTPRSFPLPLGDSDDSWGFIGPVSFSANFYITSDPVGMGLTQTKMNCEGTGGSSGKIKISYNGETSDIVFDNKTKWHMTPKDIYASGGITFHCEAKLVDQDGRTILCHPQDIYMKTPPPNHGT